MIVYADTSALVKLFITEENSIATREMFQKTQLMGTGILTHAELGAALSRGSKKGYLSEGMAQEARRRLDAVWNTWAHIAIDETKVIFQ